MIKEKEQPKKEITEDLNDLMIQSNDQNNEAEILKCYKNLALTIVCPQKIPRKIKKNPTVAG